MTPEELLKPRYKVIADYPGTCFEIGEIIQWDDRTTETQRRALIIQSSAGHGIKTEIADKYPHLFQKLEWWQERKPEDLPAYVKWPHNGLVALVIEYRIENDCFFSGYDATEPYALRQVIPATETDFINCDLSKYQRHHTN